MMGMTGQQLGGLTPPSHQQQQQQAAQAAAQQQAAAVAQHQAAVSSASVSSSFLAQAHAQLAALKSQVKSKFFYIENESMQFCVDRFLFFSQSISGFGSRFLYLPIGTRTWYRCQLSRFYYCAKILIFVYCSPCLKPEYDNFVYKKSPTVPVQRKTIRDRGVNP
jgi:hypothetical protein